MANFHDDLKKNKKLNLFIQADECVCVVDS